MSMKWPWSKKKPEVPEPFFIEHYPLANVWVVRHRGQYIELDFPSRLPILTRLACHAKQCKSEEKARELIKFYKEWHGKGVNYIVVE